MFAKINREQVPNSYLSLSIFFRSGFKMRIAATYQGAYECFEIRDRFAHGKTNDETLKVSVPHDISFEEKAVKVVSEPTSMESVATIENLDKYIEIAQKIEEDIQEHGYYPDQDHIPEEEREKLLECPLKVTGVITY